MALAMEVTFYNVALGKVYLESQDYIITKHSIGKCEDMHLMLEIQRTKITNFDFCWWQPWLHHLSYYQVATAQKELQ
jgi:hypothetical protein